MSSCQCSKWWWLVTGLCLGVAIACAVCGYWTYVSVGAIPLVGGLGQAIMRKKLKKLVDIPQEHKYPTADRHKLRRDKNN